MSKKIKKPAKKKKSVDTYPPVPSGIPYISTSPSIAKSFPSNIKPSPEVEQLSLDHLKQAQQILNNSRTIWQIQDLQQAILGGYQLNKWEQELFDDLIRQYNILYKTKLSETLK